MAYILQRNFSILSIHSAFMEDRETNFYFNGELHDFWEVVYVVSGTIGVTEDERVYELSEGDIIFHRPMEFHKVWSVGLKKPRVYTMSFKTEGMVPHAVGEGVLHLNPIEASRFSEIFHTANRLYYDPESRSGQKDQSFSSALENFILHLAENRTADKRILKSPDALRYREIIRVMQNHLSEDLSVSALAQLTHMAPSTMKNAFSKFSDCGIKKHFIKMKLAASIRLLENDMPISEISEKLGFSSQNYFSMVFKAETGLSPLSYKKKYFPKSNSILP